MKRFSAIVLFLGLLSVPSFAAKNSATINVVTPVTLGSTKLPVGEYKITWTGTAPNVQVTLEQKGVRNPVTATASAKLLEQKNDHNQLTTNTISGVTTLQNIELKSVTFDFTGAPASGQ